MNYDLTLERQQFAKYVITYYTSYKENYSNVNFPHITLKDVIAIYYDFFGEEIVKVYDKTKNITKIFNIFLATLLTAQQKHKQKQLGEYIVHLKKKGFPNLAWCIRFLFIERFLI